MRQKLHWLNYIPLNIFWFGLNTTTGIITPVLLPYLVALFVPDDQKNTALSQIRVVSLAGAMLTQPIAGMLSDRCRSHWGRRRPYIFTGTMLNLITITLIGTTVLFDHSTGYMVLFTTIVLLQVTTNIGMGAQQGLIPDLVPARQRGRASGVKAIMELLPAFLVIFAGQLIDGGKIWATLGIIMAALVGTMLVTLLFVREEPLKQKPVDSIKPALIRLVVLTMIFVGATQAAIALVRLVSSATQQNSTGLGLQAGLVGLTGLLSMGSAVFLGVYTGAWIGIGKQAYKHKNFIWWVINRLLFLAAVGSIQGFTLFYLSDVLHLEEAAAATSIVLAAVAGFLIPAALLGGYLADRIGRKRLITISGLLAAGGTFLLLFAANLTTAVICGCIIGAATGLFYATNWALGTDLVPRDEAGRYLGISNLAGAGAGIVGVGIGGPMADFFNNLQAGLGYLVVFSIYGIIFLLSAVVMTRIKVDETYP